jgi:hypothetical protein
MTLRRRIKPPSRDLIHCGCTKAASLVIQATDVASLIIHATIVTSLVIHRLCMVGTDLNHVPFNFIFHFEQFERHLMYMPTYHLHV